jgi:hypothetical protein
MASRRETRDKCADIVRSQEPPLYRHSSGPGSFQKQALRIKAGSFASIDFSVEDKPLDFLCRT